MNCFPLQYIYRTADSYVLGLVYSAKQLTTLRKSLYPGLYNGEIYMQENVLLKVRYFIFYLKYRFEMPYKDCNTSTGCPKKHGNSVTN